MVVIPAALSFVLVYSEFFPSKIGNKFLYLMQRALAVRNTPEQNEVQVKPNATLQQSNRAASSLLFHLRCKVNLAMLFA